MAIYKVEVTYPTGRVEEIDEAFETLEKAIEYGQQLLVQVGNNARFKNDLDEDGLPRKTVKPRFSVLEKENGQESIVFDSDC